MLAPYRTSALLLAALALASCLGRTGVDRGPSMPRRPAVDLRLPAEDGLVLSVLGASVRAPWGDAAPEARARFDEARWESAREALPGRADQLTYASGGNRVGAFLVRPLNTGGRALPVVLLCRDGVGDSGLDPDALLVELEGWAREGYVAIATAYRGNRMSQGVDQAGAAADVLALLPLVARLDYADPERVFLVGRGEGGRRVLAALGASDAVRAAAVVDAPTRGAADAVGVGEPLLVVHAARDRVAPFARARDLSAALAAAGTEHELVVVTGAPPGSPTPAEVDERIAAWFAAHGGRSLFD